jgi:signal transduction histidine kinase
MEPVTINELKSVLALQDLPDEHLQWILDHAESRELKDGELLAHYGAEANIMWIQLTGKIAFYMYVNGKQVYYFTFENNNISGGVGGLLPYSRMQTYPGYSYAQGDVRLLSIHKKYFHELEAMNPDFVQKLIGYMTERARAFATMKLQHEKVDALGNLAAGIAHEMNNPAAAIRNIADELEKRLSNNYELTKTLLDCHITATHIQNIRELVEKKDFESKDVKLSTLQRMENEDALEDWLEDHGVRQRIAAEAFSEHGISVNDLEFFIQDLGTSSFEKMIPWLENLISSKKLISDLGQASDRISNLVTSIKSHVHMDRTNELQLTDIHKDIENTITLLGFKLRGKNIEIVRKFSDKIHEVPAYVGELNQVWTNIIDNAIFASPRDGKITIETSMNNKDVIIAISDNGAGIPKEIQSRIFDPFFTTKKVGEGTGIGLDTVSRVVGRHNGDIKVDSKPGCTVFTVCIPSEQKLASPPNITGT